MKLFQNTLTRKSIIWTWLISYILILVIPIICNIVIYTSSISALKSSTVNKESELLEAAVLSVDDMLYSLSSTAALIENATNTNRLMNDAAAKDDTPALIEASEFLSSHIAGNESLSAIYVYYPLLDKCIGNNYIAGASDFFKKMYNPQDISYSEWQNKLNSFSYGDYLVTRDEDGAANIDFFYSFPLYSFNTTNSAAVVIRVSDDKFYQTIAKQFSLSSKNFYIVNDKNSLIWKSEDIDGVSLPARRGDIKETILSFKNCLCISYSSSAFDWEFIAVAPNKMIRMQQRNMRTLMLFNFIFLFFASTAIVIVVARKNYAPIHEIQEFIGKHFNSEYKTANEFEGIAKLLSTYTQSIRSTEYNQRSNEKKFLLSRLLLSGTDTDKVLGKLKKQYSIEFKTDLFVVVSFNVMNLERLFSGDEFMTDSMMKHEYFELILSNIFEEIMQNRGHFSAVLSHNGKYVAIIALDSLSNDNWKEEISEAIYSTKEHIFENFSVLLTANSSDLHIGIATLPEAYFEATSYQNYDDDVTFYAERSDEDDMGNISKTKLMYLSNFIKLGLANSAKEIALTLYDEFRNSDQRANEKIFLYTLSSTIFEAAVQTSDKQNINEYLPLYNCINKLNNFNQSHAQCKLFLAETIDVACECTQKHNERVLTQQQNDEKKIRMGSDFIEDVKQYIAENYAENSLNVAALGMHFQMSSYYISNQFKKFEGVSLPDYISKVRIEKAKELMLDVNKPLSEISAEVGFGSIRTFTRAFQKLEDVLPNQFKKMNKK